MLATRSSGVDVTIENSLFKIHFGRKKTLSVDRFSKVLEALLGQIVI